MEGGRLVVCLPAPRVTVQPVPAGPRLRQLLELRPPLLWRSQPQPHKPQWLDPPRLPLPLFLMFSKVLFPPSPPWHCRPLQLLLPTMPPLTRRSPCTCIPLEARITWRPTLGLVKGAVQLGEHLTVWAEGFPGSILVWRYGILVVGTIMILCPGGEGERQARWSLPGP